MTNDEKPTGVCMFWFKGELNGHTYYAHAGGGFYYCEIRIYPELGTGSVVMFNRSGMTDERFLDRADSYYHNKEFRSSLKSHPYQYHTCHKMHRYKYRYR